ENLQGVLESERQTQIDVASNAKKAYYDLVLKILNRDVEREKLKNLESHLTTARAIYEVGNSSYIDVTKAEADVATSRVSMLKAENDILLAQEALKIAMGVSDLENFDLVLSTNLFVPKAAGNIDDILKIAMEDRADYRKIQSTLRQRELEIKVAARGNSPTITGSVGSDLSKRDGSSATRDYNAAVSVNIPIEDGGLTAAKIESARAQLEQDKAEEESLRQNIAHDLRSAAFSLSNAIERAKSSEKSVQYAEENLELAQGRYEVGVGDALEVSDAVSTLATSRYTLYQALYDAQTARADLDSAMGHLPPEFEGRI
ncbi:MAG: TolC family protein, partial [Synergistaceae bacterium]|nr:TolC family protein [Synergistaceae bacterium]